VENGYNAYAMATYKVIQDIESEDKLLGPLSLRQFIYAVIMIGFGAAGFMLATRVNPILALPFLPPMGLFGLLAAPFGRDQSSEIWLLAKIRFAFKPRRRIWNQTGMTDYVQITVPKKVEQQLTDGLDQTQVKSRLRALAETLDSRGWVVKNAPAPSVFGAQFQSAGQTDNSDRLVQAATLPAVASPTAVFDAVDVMDDQYSPAAQKIEQMIEQSEEQHRQQLVTAMQNPQEAQQAQMQPASQMFQPTTPSAAPLTATDVPAAEPTLDEEAFLENVHKVEAAKRSANSHIKRIPTSAEAAEIAREKAARKAEKAAAEAKAKAEQAKVESIQRLAVNDDLNVATIQRQVNKDEGTTQTLGDDEVVISLH
jgi:hypothetical protein